MEIIKNNKIYFFIIPIVLILGIIYYTYDPQYSAFFPKCPFKFLTGWSCPGCGSQRAIHELLHLSFYEAFQYNALLMFSVPYLLIGFAFNFDGVKNTYPRTRTFLFGQKAIFVVLAIVIGFFIFRNV